MESFNQYRSRLNEATCMNGEPLKVGDAVGFKDDHEKYGTIHSIKPSAARGHDITIKVRDSNTGQIKHHLEHSSRVWKN